MQNGVRSFAGLLLILAFGMTGAGAARAQGLASLSQDGVVPLGGLENEVLGSVSVGIPIAPGVSLDYKVAGGGAGTALSFPWADVTFSQTGDVTVNAVGPSIADVPNILATALGPGSNPLLVPLAANGVLVGSPLTGFNLKGGTQLGSHSVTNPTGLR